MRGFLTRKSDLGKQKEDHPFGLEPMDVLFEGPPVPGRPFEFLNTHGNELPELPDSPEKLSKSDLLKLGAVLKKLDAGITSQVVKVELFDDFNGLRFVFNTKNTTYELSEYLALNTEQKARLN